MTCTPIELPGGARGFVCGSYKHEKCSCGRRATLLCDWKTPNPIRKSQTCDKPICDRCTTSPAPDKDLCPAHAKAWEEWKAARPD